LKKEVIHYPSFKFYIFINSLLEPQLNPDDTEIMFDWYGTLQNTYFGMRVMAIVHYIDLGNYNRPYNPLSHSLPTLSRKVKE
jgi:hypothetical protein